MKIVIRNSAPRDAEAIAVLEGTSFKGILSSSTADTETTIRGGLRSRVDPRLITLTAEVDGTIAGYGFGSSWTTDMHPPAWKGDVFKLDQIATADSYLKQGVASALMEEFYLRAVKLGHSTIIANVDESSAGFYEKLGWSVSKKKESIAWIESPRYSNKVMVPSGHAFGSFSRLSLLSSQDPRVKGGYHLMAFNTLPQPRLTPSWFYNSSESSRGITSKFMDAVFDNWKWLDSIHPSVIHALDTEEMLRRGGPAMRNMILGSILSNGTAPQAELQSVSHAFQ